MQWQVTTCVILTHVRTLEKLLTIHESAARKGIVLQVSYLRENTRRAKMSHMANAIVLSKAYFHSFVMS